MNLDRRTFTRAAGLTAAAVAVAGCAPKVSSPQQHQGRTDLGPIKQVQAGVLDIGYAEQGPSDGTPVILLHGWPYDIHSFADAAGILADRGYRVIVPYLRGFGSTRLRSPATVRNGQQAALGADVIALMDALQIPKAVLAGFDWGARTTGIVAALWPDRCRAVVPVSGYIIVNRATNREPLPPAAEYGWWYQYYFATDRGEEGYRRNTRDFNKLIWKLASPTWHFTDEQYARSATAFDNPDHVAIVIHNYRWRLSLAQGERQFDEAELRLAARPPITVPAITIGSDFDGAAKDGAGYRQLFTGPYEHRILDGIGHNVPQEAPQAFADAVIAADHLKGN